jgi:hypothetical protein
MVNISQHKTLQKKELQNTNIKIQLTKYAFSDEFSHEIHAFSKEHYQEPLKVFKESWQTWISIPDIQTAIQNEIAFIKSKHFSGTDDDIMQKIYISARFYYRKKEKKEKKIMGTKVDHDDELNHKQKLHVGFSQGFIQFMDTYIQKQIVAASHNKDIIKISQKESFQQFTLTHISDIKNELFILKEKYDALEQDFVSLDIAQKIKKAYQNRFYTVYKMIKI